MITPSFALTATERVLPKLALDFTTASLDSRVTFTRTGNTATVVNSSGYVASINADLPRFDYNPTTLACNGLLIEEARINLLLQSEDFATTWFSNSTVTTNTTVSPSNVQNADTLNSTVADQVTQQLIAVANDTVTRTFSVFLKQGTAAKTSLRLIYQGAVSISAQISITWSTKVVTNDFSTAGLVFGADNYGNGWYKIYLAFANNGLANTQAVCRILPAGAPIIGGTTGTVFAWGAQFEAGAFFTSYIPTVAATVTRNADVATMTGTNFSNWWYASEGAAVIQALPSTISNTRPAIRFDDNTANESIALRGVAADPQLFVVDGGSTQATLDAGTITANTVYKLGGAWKASSFATAINGAAAVTSASGTLPTVTQARLGSDGTNYLNGHLQNLRYWPQRLTNAEVQAFSK